MANQRYVEPTGNARAGFQRYRLPPSPWELFMKEEGVPLHKGIGVYDSRELPRGDWPRVGGKGTYIQLIGTANHTGMFVVEVPSRGALNPQKHFYEERYIVLEGRGSTEVWAEGSPKKSTFEWQPWSLFAIPLNAWFRIVNASSSPAILLAVNTAPTVINTYQSHRFVFDNSFNFEDRYDERDDYWKPSEELIPHPIGGRALIQTNLIPDVSSSYIPLDNNRGPGYRRLAPQMAGNTVLAGFLAEYPSGRYSKAHAHAAGAVLVCLNGKGYSFTWPREEGGLTPWADGNEQLVQMQEYGPGGMISAAPGPANWFHQHFAISKEPFRVSNFTGAEGFTSRRGAEEGQEVMPTSLLDLTEGGSSIPYYMEDEFIRDYYQKRLKEEGAEFNMPGEVYTSAEADPKINYA